MVAEGNTLVVGIKFHLMRHLAGSPPGGYGTLVVDFPEHPEDLVRTIVALNPFSG